MEKASSNRGLMILLAYLWPLAFVPFLIEREDIEIRWHARHGLVLMAAELALFTALWFVIGVTTLLAFSVGILLSILFVFIWIGVLAVHLAAIVKGLNGARLMLPGLSDFADRF